MPGVLPRVRPAPGATCGGGGGGGARLGVAVEVDGHMDAVGADAARHVAHRPRAHVQKVLRLGLDALPPLAAVARAHRIAEHLHLRAGAPPGRVSVTPRLCACAVESVLGARTLFSSHISLRLC